jgi:intraflagellar transport protein 172
MYKKQGMWEEALRVAKSQGGLPAWRNIALLWAMELGGQAAVKLLDRLALLEFAIEHACDNYQVKLNYAPRFHFFLQKFMIFIGC